MREILHAKITGYVTSAKMSYGSITIGKDLLEKTEIQPGEMVYVHGDSADKRIRTYVLEGEDGVIELNGNASVLFSEGDKVHILASEYIEVFAFTRIKPKKIDCDLNNGKNVWT